MFIGRTDVEAEIPILWSPNSKSWLIWKDPDAGKDWGQEEKGITNDGWMTSLTQWTWVWEDSGHWWWTGRPGVLRFMVSQRVGHDWATELNWTEAWSPYIAPPKGWGSHLSHPSDLSPGLIHTLTPYKEPARTILGREQGNLLLVYTPSRCHRSHNKALPQFFVWSFINFFWLRKARNPGW